MWKYTDDITLLTVIVANLRMQHALSYINQRSNGQNELFASFAAEEFFSFPSETERNTISTTVQSATKMKGCVEYSHSNTQNKSLMY